MTSQTSRLRAATHFAADLILALPLFAVVHPIGGTGFVTPESLIEAPEAPLEDLVLAPDLQQISEEVLAHYSGAVLVFGSPGDDPSLRSMSCIVVGPGTMMFPGYAPPVPMPRAELSLAPARVTSGSGSVGVGHVSPIAELRPVELDPVPTGGVNFSADPQASSGSIGFVDCSTVTPIKKRVDAAVARRFNIRFAPPTAVIHKVPEPGSLLLAACGLAALVLSRRRHRLTSS